MRNIESSDSLAAVTDLDQKIALLIAAFMKKIVVMWLFICKKSCDNMSDAHYFPCAEGSNGILLWYCSHPNWEAMWSSLLLKVTKCMIFSKNIGNNWGKPLYWQFGLGFKLQIHINLLNFSCQKCKLEYNFLIFHVKSQIQINFLDFWAKIANSN